MDGNTLNDDDIWASSDSEEYRNTIPIQSTYTKSSFPIQSTNVYQHEFTNQDLHDSGPLSTTSPTYQSHSQTQPYNPSKNTVLSDLPLLRRQHMTSGYREGLSIGKARVMQNGFDSGYPVGIEIGLRAGRIIGAFMGGVNSLRSEVGKVEKGKIGKRGAIGAGLNDRNGGSGGFESGNVKSSEKDLAVQIGDLEISKEDQSTTSLRDRNGQDEERTKSQERLQVLESLLSQARQELDIKSLLKDVPEIEVARLTESEPEGLGVEGRYNDESELRKDSKGDGRDDLPASKKDDELGNSGVSMQASGAKHVNTRNNSRIPSKVESILRKWEDLIGVAKP